MIHIYLRVSSRGQVNDGNGLDAQKDAVLKWLLSELKGSDKDYITYEEKGVSGTIPIEQRPAGRLLLQALNEGDTVVVYAASRISRMVWISSKFLHDMKEINVNLVCLDAKEASANASGALLFHILSATSQLDRDNIVKITGAGREEVRKKGGDMGGKPRPWQYRDKKTGLHDDPEKIAVIREVSEMLKTKCPYDDIVNATGVKKPTISNWSKQLKIKNSPMNAALKRNKKEM